MLPDDCYDCPICGRPVWLSSDPCDGCELSAARRLNLKITSEPVVPGSRVIIHRYSDPKTGKDAQWRVDGLLANWMRSTSKARHA